MPLQPGTTLGSYSVSAKIGEGGMGEVYRARDTKLDRGVALKVLPQAFIGDKAFRSSAQGARLMTRVLLVFAGVALLVCPARAQDGSILTAEIKKSHDTLRDDVIQSAERMTAEHFDFQPTPEVRTFGQLVGHIVTSLYTYCAAAGAESNPHPSVVEQTVSGKTDLVEALKAAYDYCEEALASLNDVNGLDTVTVWREGTRLSFLVEAVGHTSLHYGNMATYMRLKGLAPASTDRQDVVPEAPVQTHQPPRILLR